MVALHLRKSNYDNYDGHVRWTDLVMANLILQNISGPIVVVFSDVSC